MAMGGGEFKAYNKVLPGVYTNYITVGRPIPPITEGITAGGVVMDWMPEGEVFSLTADEFNSNALIHTGYPVDAPENIILREIFQHAILFYGYKLNTGGQKAKATEVGEAKCTGSVGNGITVSVLPNPNADDKYDVNTYYNGKTMDMQTIRKLIEGEIKLTKGTEKKGVDVKPTVVKKYGFVKTVAELDTVVGEGESQQVDHKDNIFYFEFPEQLTEGNHYAVLFEVDNKTYADKLSDYTYYYVGLGKGGEDNGNAHNTDVTFVKDTGAWKAYNPKSDPSIDVTGKTVKVSLVRYDEEITAEVLAKEPVDKLIDQVSINCSASVDKGSVDYGTPASASFTFNKNTITVTFKDVPEGSTPSVRVKGQVGILGYVPGRLEGEWKNEQKTQYVISYYDGAAINGQMTVEACVTKGKINTINSYTYTCERIEHEGADASLIKDNQFVTFKESGYIPVNAGYVFKGGVSGTTTTLESHNDALNALEPYFYNTMYCDSTDDLVKELYEEYTKRMRNERGKYFQTVVFDHVGADHESIISLKNGIRNPQGLVKSSSGVCWSAGYSSAVGLEVEMTNKTYDGELDIDVPYSQDELEVLLPLGHFLFHRFSLEEIRTLVDINTLQTYTTDRDDQLANNKVVRVVDYIHNREEALMNDTDIGNLKNNPEGRAVLYNRCYDILKDLESRGVLENVQPEDVEVLPLEDASVKNFKNIAIINQAITIVGTIRQVYITTYIVE